MELWQYECIHNLPSILQIKNVQTSLFVESLNNVIVWGSDWMNISKNKWFMPKSEQFRTVYRLYSMGVSFSTFENPNIEFFGKSYLNKWNDNTVITGSLSVFCRLLFVHRWFLQSGIMLVFCLRRVVWLSECSFIMVTDRIRPFNKNNLHCIKHSIQTLHEFDSFLESPQLHLLPKSSVIHRKTLHRK